MNSVWIAEEDDQMAFSPENQQWVIDQIQAALRKALKDIRPPSGFKKALHVMREWGILAANFTVIAALLGLLLVQWSAANRRLADEVRFETNTENTLKTIAARLLELRTSRAAENPTDPASQEEAKKAIAEARKSLIPLPSSLVQHVGSDFIAASPRNEGAWLVALEFVQYRSVLNESDLGIYHWMKLIDPYKSDLRNEFRGNQVYVTGESIPCAEGGAIQARLDSETSGNCAKYMLFVGGQVPALDGNHFKNTIFQNVRISYRGGPLILENVTFINCTFDLPKPEPSAIRLASAILGSTQVTIKERT